MDKLSLRLILNIFNTTHILTSRKLFSDKKCFRLYSLWIVESNPENLVAITI